MADEFKGLQVIDLIGVFYKEGGRLMVADEFDGTRDVLEALEPVVGEELRLLAHHRPTDPPDKERWGGGCCFLENTGECHFGHDEEPGDLFTLNLVGVLRVEGLKIFIDTKEDGTKECAVDTLTGHRSQIVVTSIPDLEEIDEKVKSFDPSNIENPTIENLTERLNELRDYLFDLDKLKNDL